MKASKTLTSAVVAAALVGGIGLAYAQTGDSGQPASPDTSGQTMQNQPAAADATAAPSTSGSTSFQTERPAQADRN
ncbi:MAG: hypothetical protein V4646_13835 [Pseudomonadota bacterium]